MANERVGFAGIGKYDTGRINITNVEDLSYFSMRSAVKPSSKGCKQSQNIGVGVAFDSYGCELVEV